MAESATSCHEMAKPSEFWGAWAVRIGSGADRDPNSRDGIRLAKKTWPGAGQSRLGGHKSTRLAQEAHGAGACEQAVPCLGV